MRLTDVDIKNRGLFSPPYRKEQISYATQGLEDPIIILPNHDIPKHLKQPVISTCSFHFTEMIQQEYYANQNC